jgi:four helix bundle suffix protein
MLCLVNQANYLIDQQKRQLEREFLEHGGFTERLYNARQQARQASHSFPRNQTGSGGYPGRRPLGSH